MNEWDALTPASTTLLTIATLFASYIPVRRAGSVSPVEALRTD
jgi:ABC-type lipoprotein release transport system permease subunit